MRFTKMHGCGNDYIYIDSAREQLPPVGPEREEMVRRLSDRHFGIGSDGVIIINPTDDDRSDFEMEMYNADGSRAEMCGNGIRCVGKFVYDKGLTGKTDPVIESFGVPHPLELTVERGLVREVRVDMGAPILTPADIPVDLSIPGEADDLSVSPSSLNYRLSPVVIPGDAVINRSLRVMESDYRFTAVSMGNPHAVIFLPDDTDLAAFDLDHIGPRFERHAAFPARTNTEFVVVKDRSLMEMRVYERGSAETLACGTGCCACCVAGVLNGLTDSLVTVRIRGGEVRCEWDLKKNTVFLTGPAETVFEGEITI